jgi:putative ABC transport system permease protein
MRVYARLVEEMMKSYRTGLLGEVVWMALDTLRVNKLRSALTVVGIVIGITAIVGMTSLIRGFDQSLRTMIQEIGPKTIYVAKFSGLSFMAGREFMELLRRPNLSVEDARAIERLAPSVRWVDVLVGGGFQVRMERIFYRGERSKQVVIFGTSEAFADVSFIPMQEGRFFTATEVRHRRPVVVLGQTPYQQLFPNIDPIGKEVRIGNQPYTVVGVLAQRPSPGGFNMGQDDLAAIPYTKYQSHFGIRSLNMRGGEHRDVTITVVPYEEATREQAMREVEQIMRIRHGLRLDEPNDFDLITQDAALRVWDQVTQATFLALVVISSVALLVGGIGVMAIMTISVTERTSEIGLRKALGARRREILWQFLVEAAVLTSVGGVLGILIGSSIGLLVHFVSGFPISLPWWSFVLGIAFSAAVGIIFGMVPAIRASRLDPIEALHHE